MNEYQERAYERTLKKMDTSAVQAKLAKVKSQLTANLLNKNRKGTKTKRQEIQAIEKNMQQRKARN